MEVNDQLIDKLSQLARLRFEGDARDEIKADLKRIFGFVEHLNALDTSDAEPLIFMSEDVNVFREDEALETISRAEALKNAPDADSDFFRVPKVVKGVNEA